MKIASMKFASLVGPAGLVALLLATPALAAETWEIDPVHSSVLFKVVHLRVANVYGRFNDVSGTIVVDEQQPEKSSINVTVQVESIDTHVAKRDQHLKSPDFFNAKQFPTLTFKSKAVKALGDDWELTGDLTIHGVTKEVTTKVDRTGTGPGMEGETRTGAEAIFTIKRSDYGMTFMLPDGVSDEVTLIVSLEAIKR